MLLDYNTFCLYDLFVKVISVITNFASFPSAWNSLPPEIKTTSLTLVQFSRRLKTEMFLRSYYTRQRNRHNFYRAMLAQSAVMRQ